MESNRDMRTSALLSLQRALWEMVTPDLRGVAVRWANNFIGARFCYEREVDEGIWGIVREVETYVYADFDENLVTEFTAEFVPVVMRIESRPGEWWAYLRKEPFV
jgi:hypothetical protein